MKTSKESSSLRIAVLIDADNAQATVIDELLSEVAKYGVASVKRAYGDWTRNNLSSWKQVLNEYAIQPIQQFRYTTGKNATDAAMIIDAMDLLYTDRVDVFCLVSSDSDFTRLATRLRESGVTVFGFGEKKTPRPFVTACDRFIYVEILAGEKEDATAKASQRPGKKTTKELRADTRLVRLLRTVSESVADEDGWAYLGAAGNQIANQSPDFDSRNYGYPKLLNLVQATELFDIDERKDKSGRIQHRIRDKRAATSSNADE